MEALFRGYFSTGQDISNRQTLLDVVAEAGLDRQRAESLLNSDEGMLAIKEAEKLSRQHQVNGVPFFIINNEITLSGAQSPDTFLAAFQNVVASA